MTQVLNDAAFSGFGSEASTFPAAGGGVTAPRHYRIINGPPGDSEGGRTDVLGIDATFFLGSGPASTRIIVMPLIILRTSITTQDPPILAFLGNNSPSQDPNLKGIEVLWQQLCTATFPSNNFGSPAKEFSYRFPPGTMSARGSQRLFVIAQQSEDLGAAPPSLLPGMNMTLSVFGNDYQTQDAFSGTRGRSFPRF